MKIDGKDYTIVSTFCNFMIIIQSQLKGRDWKVEEANDILHRLKLDHKAHVYGRYLSGGQKRKLSLAIALIGSSEVNRFNFVGVEMLRFHLM